MDAGGLAHMSHPTFAMSSSGLASRRGGQNLQPLSFDTMKSPTELDNGAPTPRTSRSHLLAGLRTAPKTASAATFANNPSSPTSAFPIQGRHARHSANAGMYDNSALLNGPKTSLPNLSSGQQQGYGQMMGFGRHYTADQILAPPELHIEEHVQEQIDPNLQHQLLAANAYLSEQQQRLQQQLMNLQAAAQQFQGLSVSGQYQAMHPAYSNMYQHQHQQQQQQQQAQNIQNMMNPALTQPNIYTVYDPVTGQQTLYVDQSQAQLRAQLLNHQAQFGNGLATLQQQAIGTPRVQISPPPQEHSGHQGYRNSSPPRHFDSSVENPAPLPPPSANAFRRGHKKSNSLVNGNKGGLCIATEEPLKSAGPKTASFPLTPLTATGGYGPGQARAGEHPVRQPRNPPSMDELKAKPTAKHEGSKNFVTRTRRSAINNLVRAGLERRKEARSSGSMSPISEPTEDLVESPMTDNDSDSGRSGSGILVDVDDADVSLPSSRTSTGSWGAIGSDRPSSRQKVARNSVDSTTSSDNESSAEPGSFASVFKRSAGADKSQASEAQRKAPMLVLTSADKRKMVA